jgi:hypothetical protein
MTETTPIYLGEARLLRWNHSDSAGRTITLELPDDAPRHPFEGIPTGKEYGQRMKIVCVAIDDHEQPLDAKHAKRPKARKAALKAPTPAEPAPVEKAKAKRSNLAAIMCKENKDFQNWLVDKYWTGKEAVGDYDGLLKRVLKIASKTELDTSAPAAMAWEALLCDFDMRSFAR